MTNRQEIGEFLHNNNIHLFGIAKIKGNSLKFSATLPDSFLENAKSAICFGVPIPKGIIYAKRDNLLQYWRYCNMTYRDLDKISNKLCNLLEKSTGLAFPIYGCFPWKIEDREFKGILPLVYWAQEAGLGRLCKCGLLIMPQYGTRILLGGLITSFELEADKKITEDLCPADCFKCIDICPVNAIERNGKVDHNKCMRHSGKNPLLGMVLKNKATREQFSFETVINTVGVDDHGLYTCFDCLKACPLNQK